MFQDSVNQFLVTLVTGILGVLAAFLIALAKKGFDWLGAKITNVKNETAQSQLKEAMNVLEMTVMNTVTALQQQLGDDIKESILANDGKYTKDDLLALKDKALETVIGQLSSDIMSILDSTYSNVETLVGDMIETQVRNLKNTIIQNVLVEE